MGGIVKFPSSHKLLAGMVCVLMSATLVVYSDAIPIQFGETYSQVTVHTLIVLRRVSDWHLGGVDSNPHQVSFGQSSSI